MSKAEKRIVQFLESKKQHLLKRLQKRGGRGIALAEHIDRLDAAIDALRGQLQCKSCGEVLTGNG